MTIITPQRLTRSRKRVSAAASYYGQKNNLTFTVRKADDGSYRCWRTR